MSADVKLRSLLIEDKMVEDPKTFGQLVTSQQLDGKADEESTDLVTVHYSRVQRESLEFMTVFEGFSQVGAILARKREI